jgi:hypothetical protein
VVVGLPGCELSCCARCSGASTIMTIWDIMNHVLSHPWYPYMVPVCAVAAAIGVWVLLRALIRTSPGPLGLLRLAFTVSLHVSAIVVLLLIGKPEILAMYAPAWRESAGGVLLGTTLLGVVLAFVRLFKSAALLVLCSVASLVLASQVFFSKMPYDLGKKEISQIERVLPDSLPKGVVGTGVERLARATTSTRSILRSSSSEDSES